MSADATLGAAAQEADHRTAYLGEFDYWALVQAGMAPEVAWIVRRVVAAFPRHHRGQPFTGSPDRDQVIERAYTDLLEDARPRLRTATHATLATLFEDLMPAQRREEWRVVRGRRQRWLTAQGELWWAALGRRAWRALQVFPEELDAARQRVTAMGWPRNPATARRGKGSDADDAETDGGEAEVVRWCPEGPSRQGLAEYRLSSVLDERAFQWRFGFRAGEFGNYASNIRRHEFLQNATEAYEDLAALLEVAPQAMSLHGLLAVAYGARGHGGSAIAHYEPRRAVFNFTRDAWMGSIAHEWFHALDHHVGTIAVPTAHMFDRNKRFRSMWSLSQYVMVHGHIAQEMETIARAWGALIALLHGELRGDPRTQFYSNALALDTRQRMAGRRAYWATPHELAARAFECWVSDSLKPGQSPWLVCGVENTHYHGAKPYPAGDERTRFNAQFDVLIPLVRRFLEMPQAGQHIAIITGTWRVDASAVRADLAEFPSGVTVRPVGPQRGMVAQVARSAGLAVELGPGSQPATRVYGYWDLQDADAARLLRRAADGGTLRWVSTPRGRRTWAEVQDACVAVAGAVHPTIEA